MIYIEVLLPTAAAGGVFTYKCDAPIAAGVRVIVPFGSRKLAGIALSEVSEPDFECKYIEEVLDEAPLFSSLWLTFIKRISEYYATPLGLTLHGIISAKLLSSKVSFSNKDSKIAPKAPTLTAEQQAIVDSIALNTYGAHLIHGVTGSGKTELYLDVAKKVIADGKKVIYLVPEISLTAQLINRIKENLGYSPAIFHSKLTDKRRNEAFFDFVLGDTPIVIGARSALFLPASNIGLIIVDEEHENTYKQESAPCYNARDMAVLYASMNGIPVILGSATPQVESMHNCAIGKYKYHKLDKRIGGSVLPRLNIIDSKKCETVGGILAEPLYEQLYKTISKGEQAVLFLNRKGYAPVLYCKSCGAVQECLNCSVALTMYRNGRCVCHYCGVEYHKLTCPICGGEEIVDTGVGTEKVEEYIEEMFPEKSLRLDADNITSLKQLNDTLEKFENREAQILIGTQIISKGLHFPGITFVGILGIDNTLSLADFRSAERAFQQIIQVSGRAGRGDERGVVHIQTHMPEHPIFKFIDTPDDFYAYEDERRKNFQYPPYVKLARIILSYSGREQILNVASEIAERISAQYPKATVLGPSPAVIYKLKNKFRYSILIKSANSRNLSSILFYAQEIFGNLKVGTMQMNVDRDPYFFM